MAVAVYLTDLIDIADMDTTGGTAVEPGSLWTAGRSPEEADTDYPIQGTVHTTLVMNTTGKAGVMIDGVVHTWSSGDYLFGWLIWLAPGTIATQSAGGLVMIAGESASVFNVYYVGGSDYGSYPYGGWQNFAVNPEYTPNENAGTPTDFDWVGAGANVLNQVSKGAPLGFDVFRYGRGEVIITGGTSTDADATFSNTASTNDSNLNRWGLFQEIEGGYKWKGLMTLGETASPVEFTDSNANIVIDNTEWVATDFNAIEINNSSSIITWTNINISALGTKSKGKLSVVDNAQFDDTGGVFTDMATFEYQSNSTINGRTYRRCAQVTQSNADLDNCIFDGSTATSALIVDNPNNVDGCTFSQATTGHAIRLATACAAGSYTITNNVFNNYNATDGSTGNEGIYNNSGGAVTILVVGGAVPSVRNGSGATTTITAAVPLVVDVFDTNSASIHNAVVAIYPSIGTEVILNATTDKDGRVSSSYNYTVDTTIRVRVRKSSAGDTRYIPVATTGLIDDGGYSLRQTLIVDANASL